jgi:hypothetical protein
MQACAKLRAKSRQCKRTLRFVMCLRGARFFLSMVPATPQLNRITLGYNLQMVTNTPAHDTEVKVLEYKPLLNNKCIFHPKLGELTFLKILNFVSDVIKYVLSIRFWSVA